MNFSGATHHIYSHCRNRCQKCQTCHVNKSMKTLSALTAFFRSDRPITRHDSSLRIDLRPCLLFILSLHHIFLHLWIFFIVDIISIPPTQHIFLIHIERFFIFQRIHEKKELVLALESIPMNSLQITGKLCRSTCKIHTPAKNFYIFIKLLHLLIDTAPHQICEFRDTVLKTLVRYMYQATDKDEFLPILLAAVSKENAASVCPAGSAASVQICIHVILNVNAHRALYISDLTDILW